MTSVINATPGPWEICEFSADHVDALPGEVGVYAPNHPGSYIKEDGTWHGVTICRGMTGPAKRDNATLIACTPELLEAVKLAYRKHHLDDPSIGWDELSEKLLDALCNAMGADGYLEWVKPYERSQEDA